MRRAAVLLALALALPARAVLTLEAETAAATSGAGGGAEDTPWATGGRTAPSGWGAPKDSITWTVSVEASMARAVAGVRHAAEAGKQRSAARFVLSVDNGAPVDVRLIDTGGLEDFRTTGVPLGRLEAGQHTVNLRALDGGLRVRVDALLLFEAGERVPDALRRTALFVAPSRRFVVRATPHAAMKMEPPAIVREFERLYAFIAEYTGWEPDYQVGIHVWEDARWPIPGATAFQNQRGVHFRASVMPEEQGNWGHEMTHVFSMGHFPFWFDEATCHALTLMVWMPALFWDETAGPHPHHARVTAEGRAVWDSPEATYDSVTPIQYALIVKYGPNVFRRFYRACSEAARRGDLDFRPGRHLSKSAIARLMSAAAGEDVEPLYRRWKGWDAQP